MGLPRRMSKGKKGESSCSVFFLLLLRQLTRVFVPSLWSSLRLSLASVMLFFSFFFGGLVFKRGNPVSAALDMDEIENLLFNSVIIIPVPLPFVFWSFLRT